MSIRNKLFLSFISATLLPVLFIGMVSYNKSRNALKQDRISELKTIADLKVSKIESFFNERKNDIRAAQGDLNIKANFSVIAQFFHDRRSPEYIEAKKMLDGELMTFQEVSGYLDVMLVNTKGRILYVTNESHSERDLGELLPDPGNKAFDEGKNGVYVSGLFMNDRAENLPGMLITAPIHGFSGEWLGVIALEIDMAPNLRSHSRHEGLR